MAIPLRDDTPARTVPWMTITLIVVNVIVFLFLQPSIFQGGDVDHEGLSSSQQRRIETFSATWGAIPCEMQYRRSLGEGITCSGEQFDGTVPDGGKSVLASLLTSMFIHGSVLHLAGNMLFLWVFGAAVEDRLGPVPYFLLYLATGIAALFGHAAMHWNDAVPVLGASGAIAGIMGAYLVFRPRGRLLSVVLWTVVYVPAWALLGLFFVTQFLTPEADGVAWEAHATGMAAGFVVALGLARVFPDPHAPVPVRAVAHSPEWNMPAAPPIG